MHKNKVFNDAIQKWFNVKVFKILNGIIFCLIDVAPNSKQEHK